MKDILILNTLSVLEASLYFLEHEKIRHLEDVEKIQGDIDKLKALGIVLPAEVIAVLGARFEILNG
jgi:hypothetical protein